MKLKTDIKPRRDGTVKAHTPNAIYTFAKEGDALVCEVTDAADAGFLLGTGNFYPDFADHEAGIKAMMHAENIQQTVEIEEAENIQQTVEIEEAENIQQTVEIEEAENIQQTVEIEEAENIQQTVEIEEAAPRQIISVGNKQRKGK